MREPADRAGAGQAGLARQPSLDFTPYGYLSNPAHRASSWTTCEGGTLRTATDCLGLEWLYPWYGKVEHRVGLGLWPVLDGQAVTDGTEGHRARAAFERLGLRSRQHTSAMIGFEWSASHSGAPCSAHVFRVGEHALCLRVTAPEPAAATVQVVGYAAARQGARRSIPVSTEPVELASDPQAHVVLAGPWHAGQCLAILARGASAVAAIARARQALAEAEATFLTLMAEDTRFLAAAPHLVGDWPASWREGLHHDWQTSRLLVQPAQGIFTDVWPTWMVAWPRAVLAEGSLDMLRLAYVDPGLAQRAVLSLFRDAPAPNVPCVFAGGEFNMVADDGSRCGTSPAWCLPFLNLELLYLRTLDTAWLGRLYPYLTAYLDWWLAHRTDPDGWLVYKCTWEAGEDGNPRLDPTGSGSRDISRRVRPVELQATFAHAAGVLGFFAAELGRHQDIQRWQRLAQDYRRRTRALFDASSGRYRDQVLEGPPEPPEPALYWGIDPYRFSALGLSPLLIGERLADTIVWEHARPPWTLWPSWTYVLIECAAAAGLFARAGEVVASILERVYPVTTRRDLGRLARPLPGVAPEFWPEDWQTFSANDAYGWGATTANLLLRHLVGFKESRITRQWTAELTPALPVALLAAGRRYATRQLQYRGLGFDLTYAVEGGAGLVAELDLGDQARACHVYHVGERPTRVYASRAPAAHHTFRVDNGQAYRLELG